MEPKLERGRWLVEAGALSLLLCLMTGDHLFDLTSPAVATESTAVIGGVKHYIVQAATAADARNAVIRVGGVVTRDLPIIHAVAAKLDEREAGLLGSEGIAGLRVFIDAKVRASSTAGFLPEPTTQAKSLPNRCRPAAPPERA